MLNELSFAVASDKGKVRESNQDAWGYELKNEESLFVVCDGIGGNVGGDMAANLAVLTMLAAFRNHEKILEPGLFLQESTAEAHQAILDFATHQKRLEGMGTTVVATLIRGNIVFCAHVGDSRVYLLQNNELKQLTKDHSYVQELVDAGVLTSDDATHHPMRNIITRALGTGKPHAELHMPFTIQNNDKLLLCTDGLFNELSNEQICSLMLSNPLETIAQSLVDAANKKGGNDNTTAFVIGLK
jgi:protein phosphatase